MTNVNHNPTNDFPIGRLGIDDANDTEGHARSSHLGEDDESKKFEEADIEGTSDGQSNERLFLPATTFERFAVSREINDGLLAPRFAPSQRAWVLTGFRVAVAPEVPASTGRDADDR